MPLLVKFKHIIELAIPAILCNIFIFIQEIVNLAFIGHLNDPRMIAAIGLGNSCINMFGMAILLGMNGSLNTLLSQAAGAKQYQLCLVYVRRARLVLVICFVPISIILLFSEAGLKAIGQDPVVAKYSGMYALCYLPALFFAGMIDAERRLQTSLKRTQFTFVVQAVGTLAHVLWSYLFIDYYQFGI